MPVNVWVWQAGETPDGAPVLEKRLAEDGFAPPDGAWLAEQDADAWWDEIVTTGKGRRYLGALAQIIGDGRRPYWAVSARQIRLALNMYGLRDAVEAAVQNAGADMRDWWEYSVEVDRYHQKTVAMAAQLGAEHVLDDLFALAETL